MSKVFFTLLLFLLMSALAKSQSVWIGKQEWSTANLNVTTFRNGDPIPEAKTNREWKKAGKNKQPAWCYYKNDPKNGEKYGKIYNGYAVNDPRGLAPEGWHVPSEEEWVVLICSLQGKKIAGYKMKSKEGWFDNGNGDNSSGFSGLPGGYRGRNGKFFNKEISGLWWSATELNLFSVGAPYLHLGYSVSMAVSLTTFKTYGLSVRCLKD